MSVRNFTAALLAGAAAAGLLCSCATTEQAAALGPAARTSAEPEVLVRRKNYSLGYDKSFLYNAAPPYVSYKDVKGVTPHYEPYSRIGNKDYTVKGQSYEVWTDIEAYSEEGLASWYGPGFHGEKTSNGEVYDQMGISAAHKNLPLPSYVKITNLENKRQLIVRVNDRGPFHDDRIIDLSQGAALKLGIVKPGTAMVRVDLIKVPRPANGDVLDAKVHSKNVQILVTSSLDKAWTAAKEIRQKAGVSAKISKYGDSSYKLTSGPYLPGKAESILETVRTAGYRDAFLVYPQ